MTSRRTRDRLLERLRTEGIRDERVLEVLGRIPRHLFVDEAIASRAYEDTALPIGHHQTISQPYIVALMTQAVIKAGRLGKVLEIGTGSGYQTAVIAEFADQVFSVERVTDLARQARDRLYDLRIRNVQCRHGDGHEGWPEQQPFDGILVTAAGNRVPETLRDQLGIGGRLVVPVGNMTVQKLMLIERSAHGFEESVLESVNFVPLMTGVQ